MDIHKPKAAHSIREFLIEIGTIVCGILIALGLEQVVETLHWSEQVSQGDERLKSQFLRVVENAAERDAQATCIDRRLDEISALLEKAADTGRLPPVAPIGAAAEKPWRNVVWESLVAGQVVVHTPSKKALQYSGIANASSFLADESDRELDRWTTLKTIEGKGRHLSDVEAESLRITVAGARAAAARMLRSSQGVMHNIQATGLLSASSFDAAAQRGKISGAQAQICKAL